MSIREIAAFAPGFSLSGANHASPLKTFLITKARACLVMLCALNAASATAGPVISVVPTGLIAAPLGSTTVAHETTFSFQGLGSLPGNTASAAYGISADGSTVVGVSAGELTTVAFRWTPGEGMVGIGLVPPSTETIAWGVSGDGSVIVGNLYPSTSGYYEGFRWTSASGMVGLGYLPGGTYSFAQGVSADGSVLVGRSPVADDGGAFRWTSSGGMVSLGDLAGGSDYAHAYGASGNGSVIVGISSSAGSGPNDTEAFRWTAASGMIGLGDLPGGKFRSSASAVSGDGSVIVGGSASANSPYGDEAFRWTASGGMVGLGDLPGGIFNGSALAASHDGSVIVGISSGTISGTGAFVWTANRGMLSLHELLAAHDVTGLTGWTQTEARGVSADGRTIAGWGYNPSGQHEAWVATISVPEPTSIVLAAAVVLGAICAHRRMSAAGRQAAIVCRRVSTARTTAVCQAWRRDEFTAQFYYVINGVDFWRVSRARRNNDLMTLNARTHCNCRRILLRCIAFEAGRFFP